MRRWLAILGMTAIAGCSAAGTSGGPPAPSGDSASGGSETQAPADSASIPAGSDSPAPGQADDVIEWTNPYEDPSPILCPEDGQPSEEQPSYRPAEDANLEAFHPAVGFSAVVRHGVYFNKEGEIFEINVTGAGPAVEEYTVGANGNDPARICLDHVFTDHDRSQPEDAPEPPAVAPPEAPFGSSEGDLIIDFSLIAIVSPDSGKIPKDIAAAILETGYADWGTQVKQLEVDPSIGAAGQDNTDDVVDFVFDPLIARGARHNYLPKRSNAIYFRVDAAQGSMHAGACRNIGSAFGAFDVAIGNYGRTSDIRSYLSYYAGAVRGVADGTYKVSGRSDYPGWYAGWEDSAPRNTTVCYP